MEFQSICLFLYTKIDRETFSNIMNNGYDKKFSESYLDERWKDFENDEVGYAIRNHGFLTQAIKEFEKRG